MLSFFWPRRPAGETRRLTKAKGDEYGHGRIFPAIRSSCRAWHIIIHSTTTSAMNLLSGLDAPAVEVEPNTAETAADELPLIKAPADQQSDESASEAAGEKAQQLTIFYGGKVVVFENFPSTKVKDLLQIVSTGDGVDKNTGTAATQSLPRPAHNSLPDLPIARRNSLHRFLEKRKGRMNANAPYQANCTAAPSKQANGDKSWLGFGQEMTIKQEI